MRHIVAFGVLAVSLLEVSSFSYGKTLDKRSFCAFIGTILE